MAGYAAMEREVGTLGVCQLHKQHRCIPFILKKKTPLANYSVRLSYKLAGLCTRLKGIFQCIRTLRAVKDYPFAAVNFSTNSVSTHESMPELCS